MQATGEQSVLAQQAILVKMLGTQEALGHPVERLAVLETHISYVLLTGIHAYKIKKAVDLGFLNFTTLDARRFYCEEELRLNRRLAPELYLAVVPVVGTVTHPRIGDTGRVLDCAVKMREFPQGELGSNLLAQGKLTAHDIDTLAERIAAFHVHADIAPPNSDFGTPQKVLAPALQNFAQLAPLVDGPDEAALRQLEGWTRKRFEVLEPLLAKRKQAGFVCECHGDLHLGNLVRFDGRLTAFDCIEFNPAFRWIDVMNDIAFLSMDLDYQNRPDFAARFLTKYLETTGDYAGVQLLDFYRVYRALVRAKVALLKAIQTEASSPDRGRLTLDAHNHVKLALRYAQGSKAALIITHGLSGSGKTTLSQSLLERTRAIHIRSDVERKRLHGMAALASSGSRLDSGIYSIESTRRTYRHLHELAREIINAGFSVIVDGAFLKRAERDDFRALARALSVPFAIVACEAPLEELRHRVALRREVGRDASEADIAVLERQALNQEPISPEELEDVFRVDSTRIDKDRAVSEWWKPLIDRLGLSG